MQLFTVCVYFNEEILLFLPFFILKLHCQTISELNICTADVITIEKTNENFRLIYDVKGRFAIHRITAEEAKVICYFIVS